MLVPKATGFEYQKLCENSPSLQKEMLFPIRISCIGNTSLKQGQNLTKVNSIEHMHAYMHV